MILRSIRTKNFEVVVESRLDECIYDSQGGVYDSPVFASREFNRRRKKIRSGELNVYQFEVFINLIDDDYYAQDFLLREELRDEDVLHEGFVGKSPTEFNYRALVRNGCEAARRILFKDQLYIRKPKRNK